MASRRLTLRLGALLAVLLALLRLNGCVYLDLLERRAMDYRLMQRGPEPPSSEIVIVAVDDASLERHGRWPWSRDMMARLLDRLVQAGAAVVGFDIVQSEPTRMPEVAAVLEALDESTRASVAAAMRSAPSDDERLAAAVARSGRAVLGYFFEFGTEIDGDQALKLSAYDLVRGTPDGGGEAYVPLAQGMRANLPELTEAARGVGFFDIFPDPGDGYYRRAPLVIRYDGKFALPLSLSMLRIYRPEWRTAIHFAEFGVESVRIGEVKVPVREDGQMLLNFRGRGRTFRHVSAADVLDGGLPDDVVRDKLVIVGVTAKAVMDLRVTAFDEVFPGVEIHATVLDNVLRQDFLWQPRWVVIFLDTATILLCAMVLAVVMTRARGVVAAASAIGVLTVYLVSSQWLFESEGLLLSLVYPILAISLTYSTITVQHYLVEEREKRKIRDAFGLYLSPSLVRLVAERPEMLRLGGDKQDLTVLFSDIRGFTSIVETLEPEKLVEIINEYLNEMNEVIFEYEGTLDKYIGDAVMAFWGAPVSQPDHAARGCRAAIGMLERLHVLNASWAERGWPELDIGVGINTGPMIVGNMGSARRLSYTVMGDSVNLGSRLEGLNKTYGTRILASEDTVRAAGDAIVVREIDLVRVKGKKQASRIFEVLGRGGDTEWDELIRIFGAGRDAYRERRWKEALAIFESILATRADGPSELYAERCRSLLAAGPGADWDGVIVMETK